MSIQHLNFISKYLKGNTTVTVVLPERPFQVDPKEYYDGHKHKVLWLLHGGNGDAYEWCRWTNVERYASECGIAVVMPSGMNAAYENWNEQEGFYEYNMYDYMLNELMPLIYGWYPISDKREDNFIAGFSMGGQGVLVYAANHPELFKGAAILGVSPINTHLPPEEIFPNPSGCKAIKAAARGEYEEYLASYANVWDRLAELAKNADAPDMLFGIGTRDVGYEGWLKFREYCEKIGLKATYESLEGHYHDWNFCELYIQRTLKFFGLA